MMCMWLPHGVCVAASCRLRRYVHDVYVAAAWCMCGCQLPLEEVCA